MNKANLPNMPSREKLHRLFSTVGEYLGANTFLLPIKEGGSLLTDYYCEEYELPFVGRCDIDQGRNLKNSEYREISTPLGTVERAIREEEPESLVVFDDRTITGRSLIGGYVFGLRLAKRNGISVVSLAVYEDNIGIADHCAEPIYEQRVGLKTECGELPMGIGKYIKRFMPKTEKEIQKILEGSGKTERVYGIRKIFEMISTNTEVQLLSEEIFG